MNVQLASGEVKTLSGKVRQRLIRPIETVYESDWHTWEFWRNAFLIYWIFSFIGHILELIWVNLPLLVGKPPTNVLPLLVVAAPYGFGALMLIWVVHPLIKSNKASALTVFILSCFLGGIVEFICAAAIVAVSPTHTNVFWDYSDQPFNLFGFVCLRNCLAFGVASLPGIYWLIPMVNNGIRWADEHWHKLLNAGTVALFTVYMIIQIMFVTGNPPAKVFNLPRPYFDIGGVCEEGGPCPPPKDKLTTL